MIECRGRREFSLGEYGRVMSDPDPEVEDSQGSEGPDPEVEDSQHSEGPWCSPLYSPPPLRVELHKLFLPDS